MKPTKIPANNGRAPLGAPNVERMPELKMVQLKIMFVVETDHFQNFVACDRRSVSLPTLYCVSAFASETHNCA